MDLAAKYTSSIFSSSSGLPAFEKSASALQEKEHTPTTTFFFNLNFAQTKSVGGDVLHRDAGERRWAQPEQPLHALRDPPRHDARRVRGTQFTRFTSTKYKY